MTSVTAGVDAWFSCRNVPGASPQARSYPESLSEWQIEFYRESVWRNVNVSEVRLLLSQRSGVTPRLSWTRKQAAPRDGPATHGGPR